MALVPYTAQKAWSAAALRSAARQSEGLLRSPPSLQAAIDVFLGEYSTHELKKGVLRLSEAMRNMKFALQELDSQRSAGEEDLFDKDSFKWQKKLQYRGRNIFNKYKQSDTCAYVAARMPAVYSAVYRVLSEISRRVPDFKPQKVLDYGSGPGTAIWAVCELWPEKIEHVNIVEPSEAMSFARRNLFQGIKAQLPKIMNFKSFDDFVGEVRPAEREHNLVIASYSLGELHTQEERINVVRQLWGLTTDMLIVIEPGHPRGSSIVRDIRSHILCMENKKLWRHLKKHKTHEEDGVPLTEQGKKIGAFVVAPCAHDGICPMDGTGKYCHFSQRLARGPSQLLYKSRKKCVRGYEDEKFSFVVLRRGCRPRMEWPLNRVNPGVFDENRKKDRRIYGVFIEEPEDGYTSGIDSECEEVDTSENEDEENREHTRDESGTESDRDEDDVDEESIDGENDEEDEAGVTDEQSSDESRAESELDEASEEGDELCEEHEETEGSDADGTIADFGSGWGRILFHPARRGKRVVIDVCCSANRSGTKGFLERITVSKSSNRVLHFQARRSRWGDLWPCGDIKQKQW